MAKILIKMNELRTIVLKGNELCAKLSNIQQSVLEIANGASFQTAMSAEIWSGLKCLAENVGSHQRNMENLTNSLETAVGLYTKCESAICSCGESELKAGKAQIAGAMVSMAESVREATVNTAESVFGITESAVSQDVEGLTNQEENVLGNEVIGETGNVTMQTESVNEKVDSVQLIRNYTSANDPGFIEGGCIITSMANLYRRKLAYENIGENIDRSTIQAANNGQVLMYWDIVSAEMESKFGFGMSYFHRSTNANEVNDLLSNHPEGVMIYAQGNGGQWHAILVTDYDNGRYKVVDPMDGEIKYWEDCYTVAHKGWTFYGWDINQFFEGANRIVYI